MWMPLRMSQYMSLVTVANCVSSDRQTDIFRTTDRSTYLSHLAEGNIFVVSFRRVLDHFLGSLGQFCHVFLEPAQFLKQVSGRGCDLDTIPILPGHEACSGRPQDCPRARETIHIV